MGDIPNIQNIYTVYILQPITTLPKLCKYSNYFIIYDK